MMFFARVLGETDPICTDVEAARAAGHPDVVAPPSFPIVIEMLANEERRRQGMPSLTEVIGCDFRRLLHGEQHYTYKGPMYAGDAVLLETQVLDFYDKRGGLLEFAVLGSTIRHADRGELVHARRTLLHRLG
jgi:acyl dehydratase